MATCYDVFGGFQSVLPISCDVGCYLLRVLVVWCFYCIPSASAGLKEEEKSECVQIGCANNKHNRKYDDNTRRKICHCGMLLQTRPTFV